MTQGVKDMATNEWQQMVMDSLQRIESKLDTKVSKEVCLYKHDGKSVSDFKNWLSIILSMISLIGFLYLGIKFIEEPVIADKQGVVDHG